MRRIDLKRFPYAVFYRVMTDGQIQIAAFAHYRRRPGYWLKRIGMCALIKSKHLEALRNNSSGQVCRGCDIGDHQMNKVIRKIGLPLLMITGFFLSFIAGRWTGRLQDSLRAEANYPWELHKKIGAIDINCKKLASSPRIGDFVVETTDAGATLVVIFFNREGNLVTASLFDSGGRYATDSWAMECPQ